MATARRARHACRSILIVSMSLPNPSANVIVRKDHLSDLERRMVTMERTVHHLDGILKGHLSTCAPTPHFQSSVAAQISLPHATDLEEPQDEDPSTDGMAMVFVEERTSAFFGESSNMNFTRLLIQVLVHLRQSTRANATTENEEHALPGSNMASISRLCPHPPVVSSETSEPVITTLPPAAEMNAMLDTYFDTTGLLFPFIHEATMRKTFVAFRDNGFTRVRRTWLGTLNMIFAMALNFDQDGVASSKERIERSIVFYKRATGLCGELSKRVMNLEIVHYLLLVVLYCQGTQQSIQAWNIHGLLVRSAMALGLHIDRTATNLDLLEDESRCRTWLTIYCLDKVLSMTFGRPSAIADGYVVSREPSPWPVLATPGVASTDADLTGEFLAASVHLYRVMGRSLVRQYGGNMGRKDLELDDTASLQASGEARKVLRLWASNLPKHLGICESQSSMLTENSRINRLRVILTLRYHNIGILVHRPLLSITLRSLFGHNRSSSGSSSFLTQLAMAEAYECISSAESTIDIVCTVLAADRTSNNNLGVWFFTLYYGECSFGG